MRSKLYAIEDIRKKMELIDQAADKASRDKFYRKVNELVRVHQLVNQSERS